MDAVKFWDDQAPSYAKSPIEDMAAYEYTLERVRRYLKAPDKVLEVGCGTGTTALALAPGVASYLATDVSSKMVEIGAEKAAAAGAETLRFDVGTAAEAGGPYDAVLAMNVLHLVPDVEADLAAIRAALAPGGLFISKTFFVPAKGESLKSRAMRLILPLMQWIGKAPPVRIFRAGELDALIEGAGFEMVETGAFPKDRRFIVARKI